MSAWVTTDRRHFTRRRVRSVSSTTATGEILEGVQTGELAATEGALFLSNALATSH